MTKKNNVKIVLLLVFVALIVTTTWLFGDYLTIAELKRFQGEFAVSLQTNHLAFWLGFVLIYILVTALSLPGAAVLTLAGGALFGLVHGVIAVSIASTIGATLAFLMSRYFFRDWVNDRFATLAHTVNERIGREGALYLFTLRLVPAFPFFAVNSLMGLTKLRTLTFFWVSQVGMLPGTLVYVHAGTELAKIDSLQGILSIELLVAFALIGILPFVAKAGLATFGQWQRYRPYRKPKKFDYNMIVIGGGSAGLISAYIAAAVKAKVALIERHKMGGDCLNTGCVPSKALIRAAKAVKQVQTAEEFGVKAHIDQIDFKQVMKHVHRTIHAIEPHDSVERYTSLGVSCISGLATIRSPFEVEVNGQVLTTKNIVIATGASPLVPAIPGLDTVDYLTSDTVWSLAERPNKLLVLGGGAIGCELALSFQRLGAKVTLIEMGERLLAKEDADVGDLLRQQLHKEGVQILTQHRALRFDGKSKTLLCQNSEGEVTLTFDQVLLALGRKPNTTGFGAESLGLELTATGTFAVDPYLRTTRFKNVFACGDVAGPYQFTHAASHQAWFVAVNALFSPLKKFKVDYRVMPWCTFTDPEVARVGLNEQEAKQQKIPVQVSVYDLADLDRAIADGEALGWVKVLTKPGSDKILGVTIVSSHASDMLSEFVLAMKKNLGLNQILGTIHPYPTFAEANKMAAGVWKKQTAPQGVLKLLSYFHGFRRG